MKKLFLLFLCMFALQTVARADDDKPIRIDQMPKPAQQFIQQHFAGIKIAISKMESDLFDKNYDVIFTDGNKVEFDKKGNWTEVNCKHSAVPQAIIPASIQQYLTQNCPKAKVLKIERDSKGYEVKLSTGRELKFNPQFQLVKIEH